MKIKKPNIDKMRMSRTEIELQEKKIRIFMELENHIITMLTQNDKMIELLEEIRNELKERNE